MSLRDIGPLTRNVSVLGKDVTVRGINAAGFFYLLTTVAEVRQMMENSTMAELKPDTLINAAPEVVAKIIACGITNRTDFQTHEAWVKEVEAEAQFIQELGAGFQLPLLNAVFELSFPEGGAGPFVEQIKKLGSTLRVEDYVTQQGMASTQANSLNASPVTEPPSQTKSLDSSSAALNTGTILHQGMTRGRIHHAN